MLLNIIMPKTENERGDAKFLLLTIRPPPLTWRIMKKNKGEIAKRFAAAVLVIAAVVGVSALAMHTPTHNRNSLARSLKSIQTDRATLFYADGSPGGASNLRFVEQVEDRMASAENLKLVAKAF